METILTWLFENTGNAGNHYLILNVQRGGESNNPDYLGVMVRTKEFMVLDLLITHQNENGSASYPEWVEGRAPTETLTFATADDVITYLSEGKTSEKSSDDKMGKIQVQVFSPDEKAGSVTFPPV